MVERAESRNARKETAGTGTLGGTPAQRALAEAEARRKAHRQTSLLPETGGRDGPDPVRYGDWELRGLASDF